MIPQQEYERDEYKLCTRDVGGNRGLDGEKERDACGEADKHTNGKIGANKLGLSCAKLSKA